jgi:CubicO group peptidase (beta-lactamase class C family)
VTDLQSALAPIFEENFTLRGELGAGVSIWKDGREVVNLAGGMRERERDLPWEADTMALVYSGTKGPAAACVIKCLWDAGIPLETPVAEVWPRFGLAGKERISFADVLSHRAALVAVDDPPDVFDYAGMIRRLELQAPLWTLGDGHGYHPRTSGYLWDEIVRRVAGEPLGRYWRRCFAEPLGLDFWMGLPEHRVKDVAPIYAARIPPPDDAFLRAYAETGSLTHRAFSCPRGLFSASSMNSAAARMSSFPAFGGIGSARAMGKFYAMLACGGMLDGQEVMAPGAVAALSTRLTNGFDRVLQIDTSFAAGLMIDPVDAEGRKTRFTFGQSVRAFGQPGAGGSFAFADPDRRLSFAYVMNQMEPGVLPNAKSKLLLQCMDEVLG